MGCYSVLKHQEHAHDDAIWTVCWASQNGLITGSLDTTAKIWNLHASSGEGRLNEDRVFDGFALGVVSVDIAPQSSIIAVAALDSKIRLFDLSKPIQSCEVKTIDAGPVDSWKIKFSPDGKFIATGGISGKVNLFSASADGDTTKIQFDTGKFAYSVDFVSNDIYISDTRFSHTQLSIINNHNINQQLTAQSLTKHRVRMVNI